MTFVIIVVIFLLWKNWDAVENWFRVNWFTSEFDEPSARLEPFGKVPEGWVHLRVEQSGGLFSDNNEFYLVVHSAFKRQSRKTQIALALHGAQRSGLSTGRIKHFTVL